VTLCTYQVQNSVLHEREKNMKPSQDNTSSSALTTLSDVMRWRDVLLQLYVRLRSHFARPEPFERALRFVQGILSTTERKNGWQLAAQAQEANPYGMERLLSQAVWNADGVRDDIRTFALQQVGRSHVIVAIDETGFGVAPFLERTQTENVRRRRCIKNERNVFT
jgi:hypothetical protein